MSEYQESVAFLEWAHYKRIPYAHCIVHNCNEGKMSRVTGARLNKMGRRKGFPDFTYPVPSRPFHSLYIELKTKGGRVSKEQRKWLDTLNSLGHKAVVAVGWQEAARIMLDYLGRSGEEI